LTGSLARGEAEEKSDIDFFVIVKPGKIWTARALATIFVSLTGYRRHGDKISGRICLNCYQTEDYLEVNPHNLFTASDYSKAKPLWEVHDIYKKYVKKNAWISENFKIRIKVYKPITKTSKIVRTLQLIFEKFFDSDWLEVKLKRYQTQRILRDPRTLNSPKGRVYISDKELRFHPTK